MAGDTQAENSTETEPKHVIPTDRLPGFKADDKASYVNRMFSKVAPKYDLMNRLMTFGLDQGWRKTVVREANLPIGGYALDVATGTGDIALALAKAVGPTGHVIASDFNIDMMLPGPGKADKAGVGQVVEFMAADALNLPYADNTFDAVTTGFAMRNVVDIVRAFSEMNRVVKPGGKVVCLEVAKPDFAPVRWGHQFYFNNVVPFVGKLISGQGEAYTYLPDSARNFPPPPRLKAMMEEAGLVNVRFKKYSLGAVAIHVGTKKQG